MEPETGVGAQAERLAQLADLHSQGVLSAEEYEAAVIRVGSAESLPAEAAIPDPPNPPSRQEGGPGAVTSAGESARDADPMHRAQESGAGGRGRRTLTMKAAILGVAAVVLLVVAVAIFTRGSTSGDQRACNLFQQATQEPYDSATWSDLSEQAMGAAEDPSLKDALELLFATAETESGHATYAPSYGQRVESLCSNLQD